MIKAEDIENNQEDISCACEDIQLPGPLPDKSFYTIYKSYLPAVFSFSLLALGILTDYFELSLFPYLRLGIYITAYLSVGLGVLKKAIRGLFRGYIFNEFFLMSIATLGAFYIGQYPEGVAVMLFYYVGELFQDSAVNKAKRSIQALLDVQANKVTILADGKQVVLSPETVNPGEHIFVKPGEKVGLDGTLISDNGSFNTSALTGESVPSDMLRGDTVLAGMINMNSPCEIKVTKRYKETRLSKILVMVQDAVQRKAKTQRFISRIAEIYTPIVVFLALGITILPMFFLENYVFNDFLYRGLIFLVISCPCALVISVPIGYFGGIGAASRHGILFKGSNYLDLMTNLDVVVFDKTGTLTNGVFEVKEVVSSNYDTDEFTRLVATVETVSSHPIANAIAAFVEDKSSVQDAEEFPGLGVKGVVDGMMVLAGKGLLLDQFDITYPKDIIHKDETVVLVAVDQMFAGYVVVGDTLKTDAIQAVEEIHRVGIKDVTMLSGDKKVVVDTIAAAVGIDHAIGDMMPENKMEYVEALMKEGKHVAFVGDGINDAPVITAATVGIGMGGLGSDAAIDTADVVIQTDQPSKIATAIKIASATRSIVWQNIGFAFGVKLIVMILGAGGIATLWEAVFADVGVALLAILNAMRIQRKKF